eukprot:UN0325
MGLPINDSVYSCVFFFLTGLHFFHLLLGLLLLGLLFWRSFHSLSSPTLGICLGEGFYLPDPCELTC